MKIIDKKIHDLLSDAESIGIFPGSALYIYLYTNNKPKRIRLYSGYNQFIPRKLQIRLYSYFDIASLSKPLSTVMSIISLICNGKIDLDQNLYDLLSAIVPDDKREITIFQLLNHSSGLPGYRPYFQDLAKYPAAERQAEMIRMIMAEPLASKPGTEAVYSDLGYILLGYIVEKIAGVGLDKYFRRRIAAPLHLSAGIFYNRLPARRRGSYAATEQCPWRGRVLRGEVSDENCWIMGGVAGHAGLFGCVEAVMGLVSAVLDIWQGRLSHPFLPRDLVKEFLEAESQVQGPTWALGFDRPTPGSSSSGGYLSPRSVGHLGFTGTSFWIDPDRDLAIVLLTNRVHPSRDNNLIREFRPYFHDRVIELLGMQ